MAQMVQTFRVNTFGPALLLAHLAPLLARERAVIGVREGYDPMALVEIRRAVGAPLAIEPMSAPVFDRKFSEVYAGAGLATASSADSLDLEGGLGLLLEDMPAAADLLDRVVFFRTFDLGQFAVAGVFARLVVMRGIVACMRFVRLVV